MTITRFVLSGLGSIESGNRRVGPRLRSEVEEARARRAEPLLLPRVHHRGGLVVVEALRVERRAHAARELVGVRVDVVRVVERRDVARKRRAASDARRRRRERALVGRHVEEEHRADRVVDQVLQRELAARAPTGCEPAARSCRRRDRRGTSRAVRSSRAADSPRPASRTTT